MRCPTHIGGNTLDLVITDVPDTVDVVVVTPLGTSDHCFVSCLFCVKQSLLNYNVRSTVFLKHRINWVSVRSAVRSFTLSAILKSADLLVALIDLLVRSLVGMFLPIICVVDLETMFFFSNKKNIDHTCKCY